MSATLRAALAMFGGVFLGLFAATGSTQFSWGTNTVGLSLLGAGFALGMLAASVVGRERSANRE